MYQFIPISNSISLSLFISIYQIFDIPIRYYPTDMHFWFLAISLYNVNGKHDYTFPKQQCILLHRWLMNLADIRYMAPLNDSCKWHNFQSVYLK